MSGNQFPVVETCCGCVSDLKAAAAIIAVYAIVTSPAITWAVVRHAYVVRLSCYITTRSTRPDIVDINLNHILSFGFGANAGLGPSCLGPYTDPISLRDIKNPAKSEFVHIVKHIGWIILLADIIFLVCSCYFLARIFKVLPTRRDGIGTTDSTVEHNEPIDRIVSTSHKRISEACLLPDEKQNRIGTEPALQVTEKPTKISTNADSLKPSMKRTKDSLSFAGRPTKISTDSSLLIAEKPTKMNNKAASLAFDENPTRISTESSLPIDENTIKINSEANFSAFGEKPTMVSTKASLLHAKKPTMVNVKVSLPLAEKLTKISTEASIPIADKTTKINSKATFLAFNKTSLPLAEKSTKNDSYSTRTTTGTVSTYCSCGCRRPKRSERVFNVMFIHTIINIREKYSHATPMINERRGNGLHKSRDFNTGTDQAPNQITKPPEPTTVREKLPHHLCFYLIGSRLESGDPVTAVKPAQGAATLFMITAAISISLSFLYTVLYVAACMSVGGSFPIFEFFFSIIDVMLWVYLLIVVNSYRRKILLESN